MPNFNRAKIQGNFNKAAKIYNNFANLQKTVAEKLVNLNIPYIKNAGQIIDLGSGTGFITKNILHISENNFLDNSLPPKIIQFDLAYNMLEEAEGLKVNGDIESLPFKAGSFDLAISSLAFQWLNNLDQTLIEIASILKPNARLCFSIIADKSLVELKEACEKTKVNLSLNNFITYSELEKIIAKTSDDYEIKSEVISLKYNDAIDLLKSIKSIGAAYSFNQGKLNKKDFTKLNIFYLKNFKVDNKVISDKVWCDEALLGKVFCSWQVFYVTCRFKKELYV